MRGALLPRPCCRFGFLAEAAGAAEDAQRAALCRPKGAFDGEALWSSCVFNVEHGAGEFGHCIGSVLPLGICVGEKFRDASLDLSGALGHRLKCSSLLASLVSCPIIIPDVRTGAISLAGNPQFALAFAPPIGRRLDLALFGHGRR
jgi:hypothetical protein